MSCDLPRAPAKVWCLEEDGDGLQDSTHLEVKRMIQATHFTTVSAFLVLKCVDPPSVMKFVIPSRSASSWKVNILIDDLLLECGSWLGELIAEQNSEWTSSITLCHALLSSWTWPPVNFSYVYMYERGHRKCLGGDLTKSMSYLTKNQSNDILNYQLGMLVTTLAWGNCCLQGCSSFFSLAPLLWFLGQLTGSFLTWNLIGL